MKVTQKIAVVLAMLGVFGAGMLIGQAKNEFGTPKSVVHIITVKWTAAATPAQTEAAVQGVKKMAAEVPGLKNVWLKTLKVQGQGYNAVIAMEFVDQAAFDAYGKSPAHAQWEKLYLPVRQQSTTHDVTN